MEIKNEKVKPVVYACAGCADVGELSDQVCRYMRKESYAVAGASCLAGIGAGVQSFIDFAKSQNRIISVDGCAVACAAKILQNADLEAEGIILTEMGYTKGATSVNHETVVKLAHQIITDKNI